MSSLFFSVIIPTFKINDYILDEALPSLEAQVYRHFEVIILPNEGHPSHKKLEKKYPWLRIVPTNTKRKPGDKRDHGAEISQGDILAFIDDDVHPLADWLANAAKIWNRRKDIVALGGPGILPKKPHSNEYVFDQMLRSWMGSGKYYYRFTPGKEQFVDDYPAMNLMIEKKTFMNIGGFSNQYWPGEDSKLLNRLNKHKKNQILYHPSVVVYHHRRTTIRGHLDQHKNYGLNRGVFFAHGDKNSSNFIYVAPALFVLYLICTTITLIASLFVPTYPWILVIMIVPLLIYNLLLFYILISSAISSKSLFVGFGTGIVIFLTHITYGNFFLLGFLKETFLGKKEIELPRPFLKRKRKR